MEDSSVVAELEGTLIKDPNPFSYFMSVAFEASGLTRFALLLLSWPIIRLLSYLGKEETALKLTIFIAVVGLRESEIRAVGRAVLPKFYLDDIDLDAWRVFSQHDKKVVVTKTPRIMVERFVKEHLMGDEVIGSELDVTRFGIATGLVRDVGSVSGRVAKLFGNEKPTLGLARVGSFGINTFMSLCKETCHPPFLSSHKSVKCEPTRPRPVIFHDGRLVNRQTPATALVVLLWIPFGFVLAIIRTIIVVSLPVWAIPYETPIFGGTLILKGNPPPRVSSTSSSTSTGVLFVCNHRMFLDPVVLAYALGRKIPAVTYSLSRVTEILSSIPTVRLTRDRVTDANKVKKMLQKGDLVVCPEGTTCREPYLLRFSALFAELTHSIVPVAIDCKVGFFHPTKARGWKGLDLLFFLMNPTSVYEVTFLDQLDPEDTCKAGKSPIEVANYVQRRLGETLGFECTKLTRKDKYSLLAENDGTVLSHSKSTA